MTPSQRPVGQESAMETLENNGRRFAKVYDYATCTFKQKLHTRQPQTWETNGLKRNSPEWWSAIRTGEIPVQTREGALTKVFFASPNMTAKYQIGRGKDKYVGWRLGEPDHLSRVGKWILIRFVIVAVPSAPDFPNGFPHPARIGTPEIIEEWVEL